MKKVNIESKNALARLMATENLTVQHSKVDTASFDVKNRVLNLPIWEDMSNTMYEGLIGHEVGHALYTPFEEWKDFIVENPGLKDYANVIEDARIEKKMKQKFPGMNRTFFGMYDELNVKDFFGINGKDVNKYGILDRINLHFKLGVRANIQFSDEETLFVNRVAAAETFEEVLALTLELGEYAKNEELNTDFDDMNFEYDPDGDPEGEEVDADGNPLESDEDGEFEDADGKGVDDNKPPTGDEIEGSSDGKMGENDVPPQSQTQKNFDDKMGDLNDMNAKTPIYVDIPNVRTNDITVGYKVVSEKLNTFYARSDSYDYWGTSGDENKKKMDDSIRAWKKDTLPVVNYMVKEFEMKQAATAHRRTSVGKTGVLDTNKMHAYKYEEDIFKRIATVKDGRNHGLVMYVDWSGSMQDKLIATVKQTITLVMFARKVGIPFRVYAFTNCNSAGDINPPADGERRARFYETEADGNFGFNHVEMRRLNLLEFFNDKMSAKDFNKGIENFYKVGMSNDWNSRNGIRTPEGFSLSSTPLNECIVASYDQVAEFKRSTGKEKVNVIFLTDGSSDGNDSYYDVANTTSRYGYNGWGAEQSYLAIRDPKTKKIITNTNSEWRDVTGDLLRNLGVRCNVNVIGFFLTDRRDINCKIDGTMTWEKAVEYKKVVTKKGYASFSSEGYDKYFMVNNLAMDKEVNFADVEKKDDGTVNKGKLSTAFKKFSKGRKVNKMLLNEFVAMVA